MSTHIPVAVIQHQRFIHRVTGAESLLLSSAVEGEEAVTGWHPVTDGCGGREWVIERFLALWATHGARGLVLYVPDRLIRDLLAEQLDVFPGLVLRDVVSGARLVAAWEACRAAFEEQREARFPEPPQRPAPEEAPPLVIATDASRGSRGKVTGLGIATSAGEVQMLSTRTDTVLAGEFAAVNAALERYFSTSWTLDILTDSQKVWARLNEEHLLEGAMRSPEETRCVQRVWDMRRLGATVRVHWVRGHNGHVLNDVADRAAVAARRKAQWKLDDSNAILERLRTDLRAALRTCGELVPRKESRDYRAAA